MRNPAFKSYFFTMLLVAASCHSDRRSHSRDTDRRSKCDPTADLCSNSSGYSRKRDICYGEALPNKQILDLYLPEDSESGAHPLLIFLHPGVFMFGDKGDYLVTQVCIDFARCGYVTAAVNYRLLTDIPEADDVVDNTLSLESPVKSQLYEAIRDVRTSIRFLKANAQQYNIDPNRVFIAGYSAGAMAALTAVFMDDTESSEYFTENVTGGEDECLDCHPVAGGNSGTASVAGVISINGAVFDHNVFNDEKIPLLLLSSDKDEVIPLVQGRPYQRLLSNKKIEVDLPYIAFQLGIARTIHQDSLDNIAIKGLLPSVVLPKWLPKLLNSAISPTVYGSNAIYDRLGRSCPKFKERYPGGHNFLVNPETGGFNCQYDDVRWRIKQFMEEDVPSFHSKPAQKRKQGRRG